MAIDADSILWRRAFASGAPFEHDEQWPPQPLALAMPNAALREASSVASIDYFYAIGEAWAHMVAHFLPENPTVLDIGCGCGKLARFLYLNPQVRYVGVDLFFPAIDWCRKAFAELAGNRFRFEHFDGYSSLYNPTGALKVSEYRLPCSNRSIDVTVCASLFTHLLLDECRHYLEEIARVLRPQGRAIISIHTEPAAGTNFSGNETRIDVAPEYFTEMGSEAGLRLSSEIGRVWGQDVFLFERRE